MLSALREGGYVLYLRHGPTDNSRVDRAPNVDLADCSTQRPLTDAGRQMMTEVGRQLRTARIPVADIHVSPLCRTRESAEAAFPGRKATIDTQLIYLAFMTTGEKAPIVANTRRLLSTPVPAGGNRVVLAHGPNLMDLIGYFPTEGTLVVFRPKGGNAFDYLGSIPPAHWANLIRNPSH